MMLITINMDGISNTHPHSAEGEGAERNVIASPALFSPQPVVLRQQPVAL
jgi:hypothetical protein